MTTDALILLRELEPVVEKLLARHLAIADAWYPHEYVPWEQGRSFVEEPWEPGDSELSGVARTALEVNLLTEDNLPSYHLTQWNTFGGEGPWGEWARRWTAEEGRHSIALRDFLTATRGCDPAELERGRMDQVVRGHRHSWEPSPLDGLVYATLQELATRISHRGAGEVTRDGRALKLMKRIAADENLHYVFYRDVAKAALEADPSAMMRAILRQVTGFEMPGAGLPGFREKALTIARAGIYNFRVHHDLVLLPVLMAQWRITEIDGLDEEAKHARDATLAFLNKLDRAASRLEERREAIPITAG